jgi:non-ribosomal peptide synthetase component F
MLNTVALSTDLSDNPTFGQLLERVRDEVIGGQANQDVPFEMVVEKLGLSRRGEAGGLFDVWFSLEQGGWEGGEMGNVKVEEEEVDISRGQFELTMMLKERAGELEGRVIYSGESYEEETIAEMVEGYVKIIEEMVERVETRVLDVALTVDTQGLPESPVDEDPLLAQFAVPRR